MMRRSKRGRSRSKRLSKVNPNAAGLDVGSKTHVVAVAPDLDPEPVRSFRSFTSDLHALADWLEEVGVTTIAMESTGVYWIPVFEILEARGFEVLLVNARHVTHGRKEDPSTMGETGRGPDSALTSIDEEDRAGGSEPRDCLARSESQLVSTLLGRIT